jgi:glycosyltransferase involved in cell wall biosynthesis
MTAPLVYFYPHRVLRDRHLDTVRAWPPGRALNPELGDRRRGQQVGRAQALAPRPRRGWRRLPLINLKRRPPGLAPEAALYLWGAVAARGPFIVELDNPYALTGYGLSAMTLYRGLLGRLLAAPRCLEIRCLSEACRRTLGRLFGAAVRDKAVVHYPRIARPPSAPAEAGNGCRFVFVATQFELKGGAALLRAFRAVAEAAPGVRLELVTHLPPAYRALAEACPGLRLHPADLSRDEVAARFLSRGQVLVHPTYVESFGMVVLEALAHGLAVVATDLYAIPEMVQDGVNGRLLEPPISIWRDDLPAPLYRRLDRAAQEIARLDTTAFEARLAEAMIGLARDRARLEAARAASARLFDERFAA